MRRRWYSSRPYFAWVNRCWHCLIDPFHGDVPYDPGDPWWSKALAVLMVPIWDLIGWLNDLLGRRP
jgi:hypothetical protein